MTLFAPLQRTLLGPPGWPFSGPSNWDSGRPFFAKKVRFGGPVFGAGKWARLLWKNKLEGPFSGQENGTTNSEKNSNFRAENGHTFGAEKWPPQGLRRGPRYDPYGQGVLPNGRRSIHVNTYVHCLAVGRRKYITCTDHLCIRKCAHLHFLCPAHLNLGEHVVCTSTLCHTLAQLRRCFIGGAQRSVAHHSLLEPLFEPIVLATTNN